MPLKLGQPLPEISLKQKTDAGLVDVSLRRNVGKGKTVILFVPLAFTGVCTDELCKVTGLLDEYKKLGADVIAIFGAKQALDILHTVFCVEVDMDQQLFAFGFCLANAIGPKAQRVIGVKSPCPTAALRSLIDRTEALVVREPSIELSLPL